MNATPHTVIGYSVIKLFTGNIYTLILGCISAFISHLLADYIGESGGIKTNKERLYYDVLPTVFLTIVCYLIGGFSEVGYLLLGSFFGNLPDIIDKKMYLSIIYPNKYKSTEYLHFQKVLFTPKPEVTKHLGWAMVLIVTLIII